MRGEHLFRCALGEYVDGAARWCFMCQKWIDESKIHPLCDGYREPPCHHPSPVSDDPFDPDFELRPIA
jgi:hypothetical protein